MSRDLRAWRIVDVQDGAVGWVQGRLAGEPALVAPFSRRRCFYFSALEDGKGARNAGMDELLLEDDTGRAIVVLAGAVVQVTYDHESWAPGFVPEGSALQEVPKRREGVLAPGERVAVHGHWRWELDPSPERYGLYRDPLPRRLRVVGSPAVTIWVTERL